MKWIISICVIVLVVAAAAWYALTPRAEAPAVTGTTANTQTAGVSDNSDSGISQDLSAIDTQINGLNSDSQNTSADANTSVQTSY